MGILTALTSLFVINVAKKATATPNFLLPDTKKRYLALKNVIIERTKEEQHTLLLDASATCGEIQAEVAALVRRAEVLYGEAKEADAAEAEVKRAEARRLLEQAVRRKDAMPSTPEVLRPQFEVAMHTIAANINSLAEAEARKEEQVKIKREGELIHSSLRGLRSVFYFRGRYFVSGCNREHFWMTDSQQQFTKDEIEAVQRHQATKL